MRKKFDTNFILESREKYYLNEQQKLGMSSAESCKERVKKWINKDSYGIYFNFPER